MNAFRSVAIVFALACAALQSAGAEAQQAQPPARRPVLMISIDGLRPDYVLDADRYKLSIPVLRGVLAQGSYARRVINVNPTVTYPNHTTLVTGVLPREHGIHNNMVFDPLGREPGIANTFYAQIKAPTLWQAAKEVGLVTGSIAWPVTVRAPHIDYNIPEYGRTNTERDRYIMQAISQPPGYLEELEERIGPFFLGNDFVQMDRRIEDAALAMIAGKRPDFLTIHISSFDHEQHDFGPLSPQANATLERVDAMLGRIIAAEKKAYPDAIVAIVSDHGFFRVTHSVNLNAALAEAGLIALSGDARKPVASWKAFAWNGGSGLVVLQNPADESTRTSLKAVLQKLAADPANGIERVYEKDEIRDLGVAPEAAFLVAFKAGYTMGDKLSGPLVEKVLPARGSHGAFTTDSLRPDMHSAFFIMGPGIGAGKNLGTVDMRRIAPTIAGELGVSMPSAKMAPLPVRS